MTWLPYSADFRCGCVAQRNGIMSFIPKRHCAQADLREQIRVSQETVERSQELLRRMDDLLAKSPLKP